MVPDPDAYWRNADANQEKLKQKFQQLTGALRSVSTEMLENILFDNLDPDTTRRTLNSARKNPVINIVFGHEYHIEGIIIAGHGRHDRAQQLRIYCGASAPVAPEDTWPDHPVRDDSAEATLHVYGVLNVEDLVERIATDAMSRSGVIIVAGERRGDGLNTPDHVAQAVELTRQLHQRGITNLSLPTDHLTTDAARELLNKTAEDIALDVAESGTTRSPLKRLGALLQRH